MDENLEDWLRRHAIYYPDTAHIAPVEELEGRYERTQIGSGTFSRVFKLQNHETWVVKEGRWDLELPLFGSVRMPLPIKLTDDIWKQFAHSFLPTEREILRQYELYLQFTEYLGYFGPENNCHNCYFHPDLEHIIRKQKAVRLSLADRLHELKETYHVELPANVEDLLRTDLRFHNFLPREYLLMGRSFSPQNKGRQTAFIFQEYIDGMHFHDADERHLESPLKEQCILLLILMLFLHLDKKLLPDTRPRYPLLQIYDWLTKTDNILVSKDGLKFIDTRWFWETDSNFVKRGLFVPEIVVNQVKSLLLLLTSQL
ncbi:MAG: hypothetical protein JWM56_1239 [Candidatus Peribacteria bacterium]|nr:hypothetical protein [Candidatus Peribacteria bacterium]